MGAGHILIASVGGGIAYPCGWGPVPELGDPGLCGLALVWCSLSLHCGYSVASCLKLLPMKKTELPSVL